MPRCNHKNKECHTTVYVKNVILYSKDIEMADAQM
jgi:hypothetical protein